MSSQCLTHSIILGIHLLLDHVISVLDPHPALTYNTWPSDFALYLCLFPIDKHHALDTRSVLHCELPHIFCRSLWPVFHGPVTFACFSDPIK